MPQCSVPMVTLSTRLVFAAAFCLALPDARTFAQDVPIGTGTQAYYQLIIEQDGSVRSFEPSAFASADLVSSGPPDSIITIELRPTALIAKVAYRIVHGYFGHQYGEILTQIPGSGLIPSPWVEVPPRFSITANELQVTPKAIVHQFTTIESNSDQPDFNIYPAFVELNITHRHDNDRIIRLPIHHGW